MKQSQIQTTEAVRRFNAVLELADLATWGVCDRMSAEVLPYFLNAMGHNELAGDLEKLGKAIGYFGPKAKATCDLWPDAPTPPGNPGDHPAAASGSSTGSADHSYLTSEARKGEKPKTVEQCALIALSEYEYWRDQERMDHEIGGMAAACNIHARLMKYKKDFSLLLPFGCAFFIRQFGSARTFEFRTRRWVREWMYRYHKFPTRQDDQSGWPVPIPDNENH